MASKVPMATKVPMVTKVPMATKRSLAVLASYEIWACFCDSICRLLRGQQIMLIQAYLIQILVLINEST